MKMLALELEGLAVLSPADLRCEWVRVYGEEAPAISPALLRLGIGYRYQEKMIGKLPARLARQLANDAPRPAAISLTPGTQLVRSWNGRTLSVAVTESGYLFEDRPYRSLSAIAREVTGTAWSGPRFFGLQEPANG